MFLLLSFLFIFICSWEFFISGPPFFSSHLRPTFSSFKLLKVLAFHILNLLGLLRTRSNPCKVVFCSYLGPLLLEWNRIPFVYENWKVELDLDWFTNDCCHAWVSTIVWKFSFGFDNVSYWHFSLFGNLYLKLYVCSNEDKNILYYVPLVHDRIY